MRISRALLAASSLCLLVAAPAGARSAGARADHRAPGRVTFHAHPVATGLDRPVTFTFTPTGKIFYGEKDTGEIRIVNPSAHTNRHFTTIAHVVNSGEQGLLGLALHPDYPAQPFVFAYATRKVGGVERDQILRMRNANGHAENIHVIFSSKTTSGRYHDGGRILFGPDRFLYAVQGEAHGSSRAQNLSNSAGKVLRMTTNGKPAPGHPFDRSRIWSYGHRNSFGMDFDPQTGRLWETENGPECTDEINRIVKGGNFGWGPNENCSDPKPGGTNNSGPTPRHQPRTFYATTIAPTGIAFCHDCGLGSGTNGKFLFGDCNAGRIHRVALTSNRLNIASQSVVLNNGSCVFSLETGPGGGIYFSDPGGIFKLTP
jgi:glucose/arabinose dehydrogenase